MRPPAPCGTYAGYQRHRRYEEPVCEDCQKANAAYYRAYRETHPDSTARERAIDAARGRALTRLAHAHLGEFRTLFEEEKAK